MLSLSMLSQMEKDLRLDRPYVYGEEREVRNCWHFSSDGNYADALFFSEQDFKAAMNRVAVVSFRFEIAILSFCLMDNHVHFVLWGSIAACEGFVRQYLQLTSHYISVRYSIRSVAASIPVSYEQVDSEQYLKDAICYDFRNPTVAGKPYFFCDYPWSSGSLLFRSGGLWTSPLWRFFHDRECRQEVMSFFSVRRIDQLTKQAYFDCLHTWQSLPGDWILIDGIITPGNYMPITLIERLFRSHKGYLYYCGRGQEKKIEERSGWNEVCLPDQELRQKRDLISREKFGTDKIRDLSSRQRLEIGKALRKRYYPSVKQISRIICLPYDEVRKQLQ